MKIHMKKLVLILSLSLFGIFAMAQDADDIVGVWEPGHGKARVKIDNIDGKYYGRIVWLKEPNDPESGKPKTDANNPDASMKNVPLRGYRILKDFEYKGKGEWAEGTIYDPETGNTYSSVITWKDDNTLDIRGYVGVKTFGRSDTWRRLKVK
jgi:uncharacterized protein (DUF2147 family)